MPIHWQPIIRRRLKIQNTSWYLDGTGRLLESVDRQSCAGLNYQECWCDIVWQGGLQQITTAPALRDVNNMRKDLDSVIRYYANGRKSTGGTFTGWIYHEDFAIKNPSRVAALLFVDPSHELYNGTLNQAGEDQVYNALKIYMARALAAPWKPGNW